MRVWHQSTYQYRRTRENLSNHHLINSDGGELFFVCFVFVCHSASLHIAINAAYFHINIVWYPSNFAQEFVAWEILRQNQYGREKKQKNSCKKEAGDEVIFHCIVGHMIKIGGKKVHQVYPSASYKLAFLLHSIQVTWNMHRYWMECVKKHI